MGRAHDRSGTGGGRTVAAIVVASVVVAAAVGYVLMKRGGTRAVSRTITIATADQPVGAAVYVALANGYFEDEGLTATAERHTSGKDALGAVLEGRADVCEVAETPLVFAALRGIPVVTFATIASTDKNLAVIAHRDRGLDAPSALAGKKIGVTMGTNGEFFLCVFLLMQGIAQSEVELVDLRPEDMFAALVGGDIDAASTWNPHLIRMQKELGEKAITFYDERVYTWTWNLATTRDFADTSPEVIEAFLRAIVRAERFIREQGKESRSIVATHIGMDAGLLAELWDVYDFDVSLKQSLLTIMEDQGRWAMERGLVDVEEMPNTLDAIYAGALDRVKPESVTMIH